MPNISERGASVPPSPIRRLEPFALETRQKGIKVYPLHIGQPDVETPPVFFDALKNFDRKVLSYGPSAGDVKLIESIAGYYARIGVTYKPSEILITNGGSEALSFAVMAACGFGDELLVPEPFFPAYPILACVSGVKLVPVRTDVKNGYHLPPRSEIEAGVTPKTRAILLSHPGNPTGVVYTPEEVSMIAGLAADRDLFIIADEVYREFVYGGAERTKRTKYVSFSALEEISDRTIIVDSISKRFSACGARIGCIASRSAGVIRTVLKFCQCRGSSPVLEQLGAAALYDMDSSAYLKTVNEEYAARRDVFCGILNSIDGVVCGRPEGAFYVMAKLPVDDAEKFVIWMLKEFSLNGETVMGAPGEGFYATPGSGKDEMRFAYVLAQSELAKAGEILKAGLAAYPGRTGGA